MTNTLRHPRAEENWRRGHISLKDFPRRSGLAAVPRAQQHSRVASPDYASLTKDDLIARVQAMEREQAGFVQELRDVRAALDEHSIVAITDAAGKITHINDKFCAISKYSREELLGQDHRIINSRHHPQEFFRDLWTTIGRGKVWRGEIKNRAK